MDAYSYYNHTLVGLNNISKTTLMIDVGIFFYKVTPFDLNNAGATCQRMRNMILKI